MGAFDTYEAPARCPRCGEVHVAGGQTKFMAPDFAGCFHRHFVPGRDAPIDFDPGELERARVWEGEWVRIRERGEPGIVRVLADFDELFGCGCGAALAPVLELRVWRGGGGGGARLVDLSLHDVLDDAFDPVAARIDFASAERALWRGELRAFEAALAGLAAAPPDERAAWLRSALRDWFASRAADGE